MDALHTYATLTYIHTHVSACNCMHGYPSRLVCDPCDQANRGGGGGGGVTDWLVVLSDPGQVLSPPVALGLAFQFAPRRCGGRNALMLFGSERLGLGLCQLTCFEKKKEKKRGHALAPRAQTGTVEGRGPCRVL
jgi:hypothetical protein